MTLGVVMLNSKYLLTLLVPIAFGLSRTVAAEERKIEENLVFSDPTVAKQQDGWSGGFFLDVVRASTGITVQDTSGGNHDASSTGTKVGFSGYVGKGDVSYLFSYHPAAGSIKVVSSAYTSSTPIVTKNDVYEFNVRWLDRENASWYVPYYLAGFAYLKGTWTVSDVVINGVTEVNTTQGFIPVFGAGVIIPQSEKYGYRLDARVGVGPMRQTSNLFSQWNSNSTGGFFRPSATVYYNLSTDLNLQAGAQYDSWLNGTGLFFQLGKKF